VRNDDQQQLFGSLRTIDVDLAFFRRALGERWEIPDKAFRESGEALLRMIQQLPDGKLKIEAIKTLGMLVKINHDKDKLIVDKVLPDLHRVEAEVDDNSRDAASLAVQELLQQESCIDNLRRQQVEEDRKPRPVREDRERGPLAIRETLGVAGSGTNGHSGGAE